MWIPVVVGALMFAAGYLARILVEGEWLLFLGWCLVVLLTDMMDRLKECCRKG